MYDPSQPPLISETLLKKRRSIDDLVVRRTLHVQNQNKRRRVVRGENVSIKRPEQFVKEYRIREGSLNKMKRKQNEVARKTRGDFVPKNEMKNTVGLVVRIHEGRHSNHLIKQDLKTLGLEKKYDAVFMNLNRENLAMLKPLDAYVAYGFITKKSVTELVHRRAYTKIDGEKKPLSDNVTVEKALANKNIICLSDLSHEIFTVGTNFEDAIQFLCSFSLASPTGHYEQKVLQVFDEVEKRGGFLKDNKMEDFLQRIL